MKTQLFALSLLAALALPLAVQAEPETTPGKQSTTTSVPNTGAPATAPATGGTANGSTPDKVPGKQSTTTSVPTPAKDGEPAKTTK